ncbi:BAF_HP2_G0037390.mRNA.1.CDS.1 [Saccharomyces cerevisiae]|nr:BAF_HP2_G0037390.mRNA.1.CDS.1 [Saccharomyces cerevisiae]CAI6727704.1 BAF_HP2_G0037390.mRNA.1.CDS.1 [Saccharomyces cerevisiae]CAI6761574.1 BAF_HP1_G0034490.mRNA.1.CDS.1 [Saccharomyces cerevisiae]
MKVSDRRKFEKANFDEFESALNNKNDLVHCPSITLFESIPTEVRSFYEDEPDFQGGPIPSKTNATTTESTNSSTNATTTASTNSSTSATTTESTNASAKEDANKDGNAEDNRFHPVTDINKESYKRKGSQMVLLERKKLKAQFPNTSENMNVLQFLGFRSDEIKHLFLYGIDIYFCPEGVFTQCGLCKGCQKMFELCVCWAGQKVSYRRIAWEALAVERMLRNDEEYKEYLEDIEPYHGDPVGYLKYFSVKRREIYSQIQRNYAW